MNNLSKIFQKRPSNRPEEKEANLEQELQQFLKITKDDSRKERRQKFQHSFDRNNVMMQVTKEDILMEQNGESDDADLYHGELILPRSGEQRPTVPNCCIICLDSYKKGDVVVWSSNPDCQHAFHRACIVKYLIKIQKKVAATPCPCCRREFTDLKVEKRRRKRDRPRRVRSDQPTMCPWWMCPLHLSSIFRSSSP